MHLFMGKKTIMTIHSAVTLWSCLHHRITLSSGFPRAVISCRLTPKTRSFIVEARQVYLRSIQQMEEKPRCTTR